LLSGSWRNYLNVSVRRLYAGEHSVINIYLTFSEGSRNQHCWQGIQQRIHSQSTQIEQFARDSFSLASRDAKAGKHHRHNP
jgi:hypothetical protein